MGKALFFVERALFIKVLVKALEAVEVVQIPVKYFFFGKT